MTTFRVQVFGKTKSFRKEFCYEDANESGQAEEIAGPGLWERFGVLTDRHPYGPFKVDLKIVGGIFNEFDPLVGYIEVSYRPSWYGNKWGFPDYRVEQRKWHYWQPKTAPNKPVHLLIVSKNYDGMVLLHNDDIVNNLDKVVKVTNRYTETLGVVELNLSIPKECGWVA